MVNLLEKTLSVLSGAENLIYSGVGKTGRILEHLFEFDNVPKYGGVVIDTMGLMGGLLLGMGFADNNLQNITYGATTSLVFLAASAYRNNRLAHFIHEYEINEKVIDAIIKHANRDPNSDRQ